MGLDDPLTPAEKDKLARAVHAEFAERGLTIDFRKATAVAAFDAMIYTYVAGRSVLASAVNTATAPFEFTVAQKKALEELFLTVMSSRIKNDA